MALPKLETPKHYCFLPTNGKRVNYRPFLVGEQKQLLIAQEGEDVQNQVDEMIRLINVCCDDVKAEMLPIIDLEYLFLQLRMKSVGESSDVMMICESCEAETELSINLEDAKVIETEPKIDSIVKLDDAVSIEVQYPSFGMMEHLDPNEPELNTEGVFEVMTKCIVSIINGDEVFTRDDFSEKELVEFLDQLELTMFNKVNEFFNNAPVLTIDANFKCSSCDINNENKLEGVGSFFG